MAAESKSESTPAAERCDAAGTEGVDGMCTDCAGADDVCVDALVIGVLAGMRTESSGCEAVRAGVAAMTGDVAPGRLRRAGVDAM